MPRKIRPFPWPATVAARIARARVSSISRRFADGVQIGETLMFLSKPQVEAATIDAATIYLYLLGGAVPGDGDRGPYARVGGDPGAVDKVQSANGVWFQKAPLAIDASLIAGLTEFAAARLAEDSAGAWRTALGLVIGTHVQAQNAKLAQIAGAAWAVGDLAQVVDIGAGVPGFARLPKGGAGQLLRMNDAGSAPAYHNTPYIPIVERSHATGASLVDISLPADCHVVEVVFANFVPAASAAVLGVRLRSAALVDYFDGAADYMWSGSFDGGTAVEDTAEDSIRPYGNSAIATTAGVGISGRLTIFDPRGNTQTKVVCDSSYGSNRASFQGLLTTNADTDKVRLWFLTQNIASGTYSARAWR